MIRFLYILRWRSWRFAKGATKLGALIAFLDESEIDEFLDEHVEWSSRYRAELQPPESAG